MSDYREMAAASRADDDARRPERMAERAARAGVVMTGEQPPKPVAGWLGGLEDTHARPVYPPPDTSGELPTGEEIDAARTAQTTALVPANVRPDDVKPGWALARLDLIRTSDDPVWLWKNSLGAAAYAKLWAKYPEKRDEMEALQLLCEIQIGDVDGPNPGAGGDHGNQHTGGKVANSHRNLPIPARQLHDMRRFHGYADRLIEVVRGSLLHGRRVISRRSLLALVDTWSRPPGEEAPTSPSDLSIDIRHGDFRTVLADLDGQVDAIITDPPYERQALPLYRDLSAFAAQALRAGGSALVMVGQTYLDEVMEALASSLTYRWTLAYMTRGPHIQMWGPRVLTGWKPVLWFTNGRSTDRRWRYDVVESMEPDKTRHRWGQSESGMAVLVERFSNAGDMICDPFVGGGSTGIVAVGQGRHFVGAEINGDHAAEAERRIREVMCESTGANGQARPDLFPMAPSGLDSTISGTATSAATHDDGS